MSAINQPAAAPELAALLQQNNLKIERDIAARLPMNRFSNIFVQDTNHVFYEGGVLQRGKVIKLSVLRTNCIHDTYQAFLGGFGYSQEDYENELEEGALKNKLTRTFIGQEQNLDDSPIIRRVYKRCTEIFVYISLDGERTNIELTYLGPVKGFYLFSKHARQVTQIAMPLFQAGLMIGSVTSTNPSPNGGA